MAKTLRRSLLSATALKLALLAHLCLAEVVINEIMYNPSADLGSDEDYEYVELFNGGESDVDLSGWELQGTRYTFPEGAVVPSQGFLVLCHNPQAISDLYGISNLHGPYSGSLDNGGEDLILLDDSPTPVEVDAVPYRDEAPWPLEADGGGSSLELRNPRLNNGVAESWAASSPSSAYGTPGRVNSAYTESIPPLISLVSRTPLSPTSADEVNVSVSVFDEDGIRFVHLYYDVGSGFVSAEMADDGSSGDGWAGDGIFGGFIPVQPGGTLVKYYVVAEDMTGVLFSLPSNAPASWLCYKVEDSPALEGEVVINEIMYNNPFSPDADSEWVELYNATDRVMDLSCWSLRDQNDFHVFLFPEGTEISPHAYLVVCRDLALFQLQYEENYPDAHAIGEFVFNFGDGGDIVRIFNANGILMDSVKYGDDLPWPEAADGLGASLECADPGADNDVFTAWGASLPAHPHGTPGQVNTVYSPGSHDTDVVINEIMYYPLSAEQQEKFVEIVNIGSEEISLSGWQFVGDVIFSFPDTATILPGEYVVIAADLKWMRTRYPELKSFGNLQGLTTSGGETIALRNSRGVTVDYVDFKDNDPWPILPDGDGPSLELINPYDDNDFGRNWADGSLSSPGRQNDAFSRNNAPYITKASHSPHEPKDSDTVVITARVRDADGVAAVWVTYQLVLPGHYIRVFDSQYQTNWTAVSMNDEGVEGDEEAGDGIYTATLPARPHRTLVRYIIHARDASPEQKESSAPRESDPSENHAYFVYNGVPAYYAQTTYLGQPRTHTVLTKMPVYHLIADSYDVLECEYKEISFHDKIGRHEFRWRGTFVYEGEVYDHIYFRLRGGVHRYHQHKRAYKISFNKGRRFVMKDNDGNVFPEKRKKLNLNSNIQQVWTGKRGEEGMYESLGYQLFRDVGVRFSYTTWVHFRIIDDESETGADQYKGDFYGLFTEVEQPDDNLLKMHGHPVTGNFYKIDTGSLNGRWEKEVNNAPPLDDSEIEAFWDGYHGSPTVLWWRTNFNLESWYSYHAIVDAIHHTDIGAGKNYYYHRHPQTKLWEVFPWDLDLTFDVPYGGGQGPFVDRVLGTYPDIFGIEYKNRLREILQLIYTPNHIFPIIEEWRNLIIEMTEADRDRWDQMPLPDPYPFQGRLEQTPWQNLFQSLDYRINGLKNWITSRRATMSGWALDADIPAKPANQSPPDGAEARGIPLLVTSPFSDPNGSLHMGSRWIVIERGGDWAYPLWDSGEDTLSKISIAIPSEVLENQEWYEWRAKHLDNTNRWSDWSDPTSFQALVATDSSPPTPPAALSAETPDYTTVILSWGAAADPDSGILGYQVSRDGVVLAAGLTALSYTDGTVQENTLYQYEVIAVNGGGIESQPAQVAVTTPQDDVPPRIVHVEAIAQDKIRIVFDEPVSADSANKPVNYRLTHWASVLSAAVQPDGKTVELTTSLLSDGLQYGLTVNNVTDASSRQNAVAPNSGAEFTTEFEVEVTDVWVSTGSSIIAGGFGVGSFVYSDHLEYRIGSPIPEELSGGASQLRLPNAPEEDRYNTSAEYLRFNVTFDVEVWVGYRRRNEAETLTLPAWLSDGTWEDATFTQYVDKSGSARYHDFYKKLFHRGEVVLGGNAQPPASGHSNYIVVVRPLSPPDPDLDDDGMLDDWEIAWFGNTSRQPAADDDRDGKTNFEEFVAGTSPLDSASFFAIQKITINGDCLEIAWPGMSFKYYQVYCAPQPDGEWVPLGQPHDSSTGIQVDEEFPSLRQRYYRIEVW